VTKSEYARQRRARLNANGLCQICGHQKLPDRVLCAACISRRRETNAAVIRTLRSKAVANGDCYCCRARPAQPGLRYCEQCGHWRATRERNRVGWCDECLAFGEHRRDCPQRGAA